MKNNATCRTQHAALAIAAITNQAFTIHQTRFSLKDSYEQFRSHSLETASPTIY